MAGMFYSLKEVISKLSITEDQVHDLVKQGKLREFRDGTNLLFKVEEVEKLAAESKAAPAAAEPAEMPQVSEDEIFLVDEPEEQPSTTQPQEKAPLPAKEQPEEQLPSFEEESQESGGMAFPEELTLADDTSSDELSILQEQEEKPTSEKTDFAKDIDLLKADTSAGSIGLAGTGEDTSIAKEAEAKEADSLEDIESQYQIPDDTAGETKVSQQEEELKKIEDDVNLDTFGSGSGLLDLSLQADDTSLGGILDEIYTEGKEEQGIPAAGSAMDMAAQTEEMLAEAPYIAAEAPPVAALYAEPEPDTSSNAFGIMMILPLLAVIYTAIVAIANFNKGIIPAILKPIQSLIWFIAAGLVVLSLIIIAVPFFMGGESTGKKNKIKPPKPKKEKAKKQK